MIEREVDVVAVNELYVEIEAVRESACQHCTAGNTCGTSVLDKWMHRKNRFMIDRTLDLQAGEKVIVGIEEMDLLRSAFVIYMMPVLIMLLTSGLVSIWTASQGIIAMSGLMALIAGLFAMRHSPGSQCSVNLLRKVKPQIHVTTIN